MPDSQTPPRPKPAPQAPELRVAANSGNTVTVRDVPNILILVGGTVDPGNTDTYKRSESYQRQDPPEDRESNWYWEENPDLWNALKLLGAEYTSLALFPFHGWSGDNAVNNRKVAGAYLANRLHGSGGEKPFYPAYREREVALHLIGHSHGGNVINEFTRRAAEDPKWPKKWKIRSITYLSTPFFKRLHQLDAGACADGCRIIYVHNTYDLTQRVAADFSLLPLIGLLSESGAAQLVANLERLSFDPDTLYALTPASLTDMDPHPWRVDYQLMMDPAAGARLYRECLQALDALAAVLDTVRAILRRLAHEKLSFPVSFELEGKLTHERTVLTPELEARFLQRLAKVEAGLALTQRALSVRVSKGQYPVAGFFEDIHVRALLTPLTELISVDPATLRGPLWDFIHDLVKLQLDEFDNTTTSPLGQAVNAAFNGTLQDVDVTDRDPFHQHKAEAAAFRRFVANLEAIEARYALSGSQYDLMDLVFSLLAGVEPVRVLAHGWATKVQAGSVVLQVLDALDKVAARLPHVTVTPFLEEVSRLTTALADYGAIVQARDFGRLLVVPEPRKKNPTDPPQGDLNYFLRVSHSISRMDLWPEVEAGLTKQLTTRKRRSPKPGTAAPASAPPKR